MKRRLEERKRVVYLAVAVFFLLAGNAGRLQAATQRADAVVLVNSASPKFADFSRYLQPYLDNFGVPYTVLDIASNSVGADIGQYAAIIVGHSQLDTSQAHLTGAAQSNLVAAVSEGTGLVNFDDTLTDGAGANGYPYVQGIFGFGHGAAGSGANVTFPATEGGSQMHYIAALHAAGSSIALKTNLRVSGLSLPSHVSAVATVGGKPLLAVTKFGQGRAVQWGSYGWMAVAVKGPLAGLDDLVWRSIVWAARKPFVMRGLPNLVTMRVDDCEGPFAWAQTAIQTGFKPYISFYVSQISEANAAVLRGLVTNGNATASIHSFTSTTLFYAKLGAGPYPDSVMASNLEFGRQWHARHGIPISKVLAPHYSEIGPNAFPGIQSWGVEFVATEVVPGMIQYGTPGAPWLMAGPYRLHETPGAAQSASPYFYADFLSVPGLPELTGRFFNCVTAIRDDTTRGEWCPDNDVAGSIGRGTRQLKRALDSHAMAMLFTHEWYIDPINGSKNAAQTYGNNWRAILQGITNNLASYQPQYVTLDYACRYVRATRTSRLVSGSYDSSTGLVSVNVKGNADLGTKMNIYVGEDRSIAALAADVPAFSGLFIAAVPVPPKSQGTAPGSQILSSLDSAPSSSYAADDASATNATPASLRDSQQKLERVVLPAP